MERLRLDQVLVKKGIFETRARAQSAIKAGHVFVEGRRANKASLMVDEGANFSLSDNVLQYVSRGGLKLEAALDYFDVSAAAKICLDLGASTGGFCDVLLRSGAKKIYAVDVGHGQLHPSINNDRRVINLEKTHARDLSPDNIPEKIDLLVVDVSFISLKKTLPFAFPFLKTGGHVLALVKPQFELGPDYIGKNGVVIVDSHVYESLQDDMMAWFEGQGLTVQGYRESPIHGGDGNREFLINAYK